MQVGSSILVPLAQTVLRALSARRPRSRYLAGKGARRLAFFARWMPDPLQSADAVVHELTALRKPPLRHSGMAMTDRLRSAGTTNLLAAAEQLGARRGHNRRGS